MPESDKPQIDRFKKAARETDADMTKEEFDRVIGGLAKPQAPAKEVDAGHPTPPE